MFILFSTCEGKIINFEASQFEHVVKEILFIFDVPFAAVIFHGLCLMSYVLRLIHWASLYC